VSNFEYNESMKEKIAKNTTWFTGSLVIQKILSFIYFWFISNSLFPGDLGKYVFALSFTTMFSIFIDLGLSQVLIREGAKNLEKRNDYLKNILAVKIPLTFLTVLAAILIINISGKPDLVKLLVYLACIIMVLDSFTLSFYSVFRSAHNLKFESIGSVIFQIINFIFGVTALKITGQIQYLMIALVTASLFNFIFALSLLKIKLRFKLKPKWQPDIIKYLLKIVPAFAFAGIFIKIYNTSDAVLLGYLADDQAVGYFSVPAKVVFALQMIIAGSFAAVIYPAYSYYFEKSKETLKQIYEHAVFYLMFLSIPMALGLFVLTPLIIDVLWPEYEPSLQTFKVMALAMPFIFVAFATGTLLNACDRQKNNTINRGIIMTLAIIFNVVLIPTYAQYGAGITFLVVNIILLALDLYWVEKVFTYKKTYLLTSLLKILVASIAMSLVTYYLLYKVHILIIVSIASVLYFVILYALKGFTILEIKNLIKTLKTKDEESSTSNN